MAVLIFKEEARADIVNAFSWYEEQSEGLGHTFLRALESVYDILLKHPLIYQKVYKDFRQAIVKKFPFVVLYAIEKDTIVVLRVFHTLQDPDKRFSG